MKPTEADIQAELIEGWEISEVSDVWTIQSGGYFEISGNGMRVTYYRNSRMDLCVKRVPHGAKFILYTDFLTGNYDLSAISQHYDSEEWQRIITMCESIVRLITGEQVEQTLEEKVREILEPLSLILTYAHDDEVSLCSDAYQYWITETHVRWAGQEKTLEEYHKFHGAYRKAFEAIAALLTEQPEQTLEEAVRGKIKDAGFYYTDLEVHPSCTKFSTRNERVIISSDGVQAISLEDAEDYSHVSIGTFMDDDDWCQEIRDFAQAISHLHSQQPPKPSYSDLEQRVEELEKYIASDYCKENCELREEIDSLNESYEQIAETKTRVLDALEATQTELKEKKSRITDLEAQLQDYISPADHEAEIEKWSKAFDGKRKEAIKHFRRANKYQEWWEFEYAKNAEASQ